VLDRNCVTCHCGLKPAGGNDFSGGLTTAHNRAYDTIIDKRLISYSDMNDDSKITMPLMFGSHKSRLIAAVRDEAHASRINLSANDWLALVTWVDANGPYHDGFRNMRPSVAPYEIGRDDALPAALEVVHARRCADCHAPGEVTRLDWIDIQAPAKSRFLTAPLAGEAGGQGTCTNKEMQVVYANTDDADYKAVLDLVVTAMKRAWDAPRRDLASFNDPIPAPRVLPSGMPVKEP